MSDMYEIGCKRTYLDDWHSLNGLIHIVKHKFLRVDTMKNHLPV